MKKLLFISIIFLGGISLDSCGGKGNLKENTKENVTKTKTELNESKVKSKESILESEKLVPAKVKLSIYFDADDYTDEETGETIKGSVEERDEFRLNNSYTFCYDSEGFDHLILNGTGKKLTFIIDQGGFDEKAKQIFKKENFDLSNKLIFTRKDFDLNMGYTYDILLYQEKNIVFKGKINSQGCM
jgi:hypothetical protein